MSYIQKKLGKPQRPSDGSDDEYEPPNTYNRKNNPYSALPVSSDSDKEPHVSSDSDDTPGAAIVSNKVTQQKKRRRRRYPKIKYTSGDEIDRSIREVNAILGEPSSNVEQPVEEPPNELELLFSVKQRNLNMEYELTRKFGPEIPEGHKKRGRPPHQMRYIKKNAIIQKEYLFLRSGLSMSIDRTEDGYIYFTYDHNKHYQQYQRELLMHLLMRNNYLQAPFAAAANLLHVEGMLESVDIFCKVEDYTEAKKTLDKIIAYLQHVAHPYFDLTSMKVRLEYRCVENRIFHIAILKYIHFLTNMACHRTALELSKLLLNLDPSDPLAIISVIDIISLRERLHFWLIRAIDCLDGIRSVKHLYNIQFSYAMAHFHVACQQEGDLTTADLYLKQAMKKFPSMFMEIILQARHVINEPFRNHILFNGYAKSTTSPPLQKLIALYAAFTVTSWKEQQVMQWLVRNATELAELYDNDDAVKSEVVELEQVRRSLFRVWPVEVYRHLCAIKAISFLIVDGAVPDIEDYSKMFTFNPAPPEDNWNRYNYPGPMGPVNHVNPSVVRQFISSMHPMFSAQLQNEPRLRQLPHMEELDSDDFSCASDEENQMGQFSGIQIRVLAPTDTDSDD